MLLILLLILIVCFPLLVKLKRHLLPKEIKGDVVLITGGASGIGYLMAHKFRQEGCDIVVWDLNQEGLDKLESEFKALGAKIVTQNVDLTKRENVEAAGKTLLRMVSRVDILVNNAGIVTGRPFLECSPELIQRTIDVNTTAHFWTCRAFLPGMIERKKGHVVTIASMAGHTGVPRLADYAASKFGAVGFDESLRVEMKKMNTGVKTTCVCPFYISTGMFDGVKSRLNAIMPILTPEYVVDQIVAAVKRNDEVLWMPWSMNLVPLARLLPIYVQDWLSDLIGVHDSMNNFVGHVPAPVVAPYATSNKKMN